MDLADPQLECKACSEQAYHHMQCLISLISEVQVMVNCMVAPTVDGLQYDLHVELAPPFLLQEEGWLLNLCWLTRLLGFFL